MTAESGRIVEVQAPAKLNLFLEVLGRRPDGYHEIESLMVTTDLRDHLSFEDDPSGLLVLDCDDPNLSTGPDNLVIRAAEALRRESGTDRGARIRLSKRIPAQAGLGGGSSDAAATLRGLSELWRLDLDAERLERIGAGIGSDVPFFLHGPAAVCRGRGERVEPVALGATTYHFVLARPDVGVSTADAYQNLELPARPEPIGPILEAFRSGDSEWLGRHLFNRLQPVAEGLAPDLVRVREALTSLTPSLLHGVAMSGSGSAYFGLARDRDAAFEAARQLEAARPGWARVATCGP